MKNYTQEHERNEYLNTSFRTVPESIQQSYNQSEIAFVLCLLFSPFIFALILILAFWQ